MPKVSILLALIRQFVTVLYPWQEALPPHYLQASGRPNRSVNQKLFLRSIHTLSFPTSAVVIFYRSGLHFSANLLRTYLCHLLASFQVHHKCKDVCLVMVRWRCKDKHKCYICSAGISITSHPSQQMHLACLRLPTSANFTACRDME